MMKIKKLNILEIKGFYLSNKWFEEREEGLENFITNLMMNFEWLSLVYTPTIEKGESCVFIMRTDGPLPDFNDGKKSLVKEAERLVAYLKKQGVTVFLNSKYNTGTAEYLLNKHFEDFAYSFTYLCYANREEDKIIKVP